MYTLPEGGLLDRRRKLWRMPALRVNRERDAAFTPPSLGLLRPGRYQGRAVIKTNYTKERAAAVANIQYIERGSADGLFTQERDDVDGRQWWLAHKAAGHVGRNGTMVSHRIVLSPDLPAGADLPGYAREVMKNFEQHVGRRLHWVAASHSGREHEHVHVHLLARGENLQGELRTFTMRGRDLRQFKEIAEHARLRELEFDRSISAAISFEERGPQQISGLAIAAQKKAPEGPTLDIG